MLLGLYYQQSPLFVNGIDGVASTSNSPIKSHNGCYHTVNFLSRFFLISFDVACRFGCRCYPSSIAGRDVRRVLQPTPLIFD